MPSASGTASPAPQVFRFRTEHHFLNFVMDGDRLVFSGGDPVLKTSSPEIYSRGIRTGDEVLVARASTDGASVTALASRHGKVVFAETATSGRMIYRVHSHVAGVDTTLDELVVDDPARQSEYRGRLVPPIVATDGTSAVWVSGRITEADRASYELVAAALDGSQRRVLYATSEWIGYPRIDGEDVFFTTSFQDPAVWRVSIAGGPARLFARGESEAAAYAGRIVTKSGGENALAPAGIALWDRAGDRRDLAPATSLAYEPSINERYVVWWGATRDVLAYDVVERRQVVLPRAVDGTGGMVGRQTAFPGSVAWLWIPTKSEDLTVATANEKPYFQVLLLPP